MSDEPLDQDGTKARNGQPENRQDRLTEPVDHENPPRLAFPVVAIGGSAGGLEAFIAFFRAMPASPGMAFIVVQHLPADRESMIAEILSRHTTMPVQQIEDGVAVEEDNVYVIRPGKTLTLKQGRLHLSESLSKPGHGRPIDDLFRSVAEEQRERAICIIMSGMGSNGSAGTEAIKTVGGLAIAQDPDTAKYPSMPRHLIDSRNADLILRPEEMPEALLGYTRHFYVSGRGRSAAAMPRAEQALGEILTILRTRARHDFTGYKKATILRRIQRRMGLAQVETLPDYVTILRQNPGEITALVDDLMIHVTGFFRDPEAWEALRTQVIIPIVREKEQDGTIRCWVTACATGEEAYTLAMLLHEVADVERKILDIKVFATDMAERTLSHARSGVYPGGIEGEIAPERLERFFDRDDSVFRVKREIRESVVFAPQNVTQDPPFSRLDIVTCRNLLIYLEPELQERVLSLMHFGLVDGGILFLGSSETVSTADTLFTPVDKRFRIYRRVGPTRHGILDFPRPSFPGYADLERAVLRPGAKATLAQITSRVLLERHTPAAVTIDRQHRVAFFHGKTDEFLTQPAGEPTRDLMQLVREPIRGAVRTALQKVAADNAPHTIRDGYLDSPEGRLRIVVTVEVLEEKQAPGCFLVSFAKQPELVAQPAAEGKADPVSAQLQLELERMRDELQSTVEELQSSNEELETSKEELQSLNEELVTVNAQLQSKMEELESTTSDLSSLLTSTSIAVVFLDVHFRIRQFTPAIADLIDLIPSDVGRPLKDLATKFDDPQLIADCAEVLNRLVPRETEVHSETGRYYMRRIHPYRTTDNRITGIVVTFIDISGRKETEASLRTSEERLRVITDGALDFAMVLLDVEGRIATWNLGAERILGYTEREAVGQSGMMFLPGPSREAVWKGELETAVRKGKASEDKWHVRKDGSEFWGSGMLHALFTQQGEPNGFVKVLRDDSARKRKDDRREASIDREKQARLDAEWATGLRDRFLAVLSHELRTPLSAILIWAQVLQNEGVTADQLKQGLKAIEVSAEAQKQLLNELLDTSRIASGKIQLHLRATNLQELIQSTVETLRPNARDADVTLDENLPEREVLASLDPDRIRQVLVNLLTNAIKFNSRPGRVTITLQPSSQELLIRIEDTGRGIEASFLPHVFDPFSQQDTESTRTHGGLGLGLAISKQLVELHGGTIQAHSAGVRLGSTFTIRLPYTRQLAGPSSESRPSGLLPSIPAGSTVLLIEDDEQTRLALVSLLERGGADVTALPSAVEAVRTFETLRPQLVISDIGLPGEDGFALMRRLREFERQQNLPPTAAIALTAFAREDDQLQALQAGFQQHVSKPVDGDLLLQIVADYLTDPKQGA